MKKLLIVVVFLFVSVSAFGYEYFENYFKGLQVGYSSYSDVIKKLGQPIRKKMNSNNFLCIYDGYSISIHNHNRKINTFIITTKDYIDPNGFCVGDSIARLKAAGFILKNRTVVDLKKGIIYWLHEGHIKRIVLAHRLMSP